MNELKELLGKTVFLFDETGGVLDENTNYVKDWWAQDDLVLVSFRSKYLFVKNPQTNRTGRILIKRIKSINKNEIVLAKL